jgi:hypothetical protein
VLFVASSGHELGHLGINGAFVEAFGMVAKTLAGREPYRS